MRKTNRRIKKSIPDLFDLKGRVAVITGGAGFLAEVHGETLAEAGSVVVLADIDEAGAKKQAARLSAKFKTGIIGHYVDVTDESSIRALLTFVSQQFGRVDILINNAARNPKMEQSMTSINEISRLEHYPLEEWEKDLSIGLTGAMLCSRIIGGHMAQTKGGVILNIASDLGVIAPDQRIYRVKGLPEKKQKVKPISYSVVKGGLIMLTKYLATYWADKKVRVNSLSSGGVRNNQPKDFVTKLSNLIPMKRMAEKNELKGVVLFLCSDASSYMTGSNVVVDGGRTAW
jgi:NAD(P)-dependent dehydrogenase (short-subunit alcohol dehydrogenase family)